jgi:hypothetical protein
MFSESSCLVSSRIAGRPARSSCWEKRILLPWWSPADLFFDNF